MKAVHWIVALAGVVGVVCLVTFWQMYVGEAQRGNSSGPPPGQNNANPALTLEFAATHYPGPPDKGAEPVEFASEVGGDNHHDFWFVNPHDQEVRVGLN